MTMVLAPDRKAQAAKKDPAKERDDRPAEPADETAAQDTPA